jgi:hypothetical protein
MIEMLTAGNIACYVVASAMHLSTRTLCAAPVTNDHIQQRRIPVIFVNFVCFVEHEETQNSLKHERRDPSHKSIGWETSYPTAGAQE